jgi:ubiquinone biosynthesis protein
VAIVTYFHEHHGERIARDMGIDRSAEPVIDLDGVRASFGLTDPVERFTYRELRERRELIRHRLEQRQRRGSRHAG